MPLPTSPTILLAAAGLSLVLGWVLRFRVRGIWESFFFSSILLAGYLLYADPMTSTAIADGPNFRRVWVNDPLAVSEQWLVLAFGFLSGIAMCSKGTSRPSEFKLQLVFFFNFFFRRSVDVRNPIAFCCQRIKRLFLSIICHSRFDVRRTVE